MKRLITVVLLIVAAPAVMVMAQMAKDRSGPPIGECPRQFAQADDDSAWEAGEMPPPPDRPGKGQFRDAARRFEHMRMNKLMEFLELEGDAGDTFIKIADKYRKKRFEHGRTHRFVLDTLARGLREGKLGKDEIIRLIEKIDMLEEQKLEIDRQFHEEVRPILTVEQFAKCRVFEIRFQGQLLRKLNEFRGVSGHKKARGVYRKALETDKDSI